MASTPVPRISACLGYAIPTRKTNSVGSSNGGNAMTLFHTMSVVALITIEDRTSRTFVAGSARFASRVADSGNASDAENGHCHYLQGFPHTQWIATIEQERSDSANDEWRSDKQRRAVLLKGVDAEREYADADTNSGSH